MAQQKRKKVVILGGGASALASAYQLTNDPDWQHTIESITVYQLGWRLGGKGASGRGECDRIEEHGLHIWIGFYENAFKVMSDAYASLGRKPDEPLWNLENAFARHSYIVMNEEIGGKFIQWPVYCPEDLPSEAMPGTPRVFPLWKDLLYRVTQLLGQLFGRRSDSKTERSPTEGREDKAEVDKGIDPTIDATVAGIRKGTEPLLDWWIRIIKMLGSGAVAFVLMLISQVAETVGRLGKGSGSADVDTQTSHGSLDRFRNFRKRFLDSHQTIRHAFVLFDMVVTCLRGVILGGSLFQHGGIDALDRFDLREWMFRFGCATETAWSGPIRFLYDLGFAYIGGDPQTPSFAAGTALRCIWRVFFAYRGAIFWKMQAGMGETVFTPLYRLLLQRGVRFEFFHKVKNLELSSDHGVPSNWFTPKAELYESRPTVARIRIARQVTLKNGTYSPLIRAHDGLECWPTQPLYDQLVQGDALAATRDSNGFPYNLESFWTPWPDVDEIVLEAGRDFDAVIFGISLGSVPYVCAELLKEPDSGQSWRDMVAHVQTTRTMGLQLWMKPTLQQTGWPYPAPVMDGYAEPLNTWADMTHLLPRENWPRTAMPGSLAYLCGTIPGGIPNISEHDAPEKEYRAAHSIAKRWLQAKAGGIWPGTVRTGGTGMFDWNLLVDVQNREGIERLAAQYWRANIDPSERYVLSVAGSTHFRIRPDEAGFGNLVIVGDWTQCGLNVGCIEAAVMSGMKGANAVLGVDANHGIVNAPH